MPKLARITVYPIKSLDGRDVASSGVLPSGALEHDRRFALIDADHRFVNGKRTPGVHGIRAEFDRSFETVRLTAAEQERVSFPLTTGPNGPESWLANALGHDCTLQEETHRGFPDDTEAPGPTLVSTATLEAIAGWFSDMTIEECRRRFRTNLEIDAPAAFWEDRLVGRDFEIGGVLWHATGVCQRCVVPSRNTSTGEPTDGFQKTFAARRRESLPEWSPEERFNHFYRVAINTEPAAGFRAGDVKVGDELLLL